MLKCWCSSPDDRPSFSILAKTFTDFIIAKSVSILYICDNYICPEVFCTYLYNTFIIYILLSFEVGYFHDDA